MYRLDGQVAVVTGSAQGIGKACALKLGREGADVALLDICKNMDEYPEWEAPVPEALQAVAEEIAGMGRRVLVVLADVRNKVQVAKAIEKVAADFGRIDILVNVAGVGVLNFLDDVDEVSDWDRTIDVNLKGTFLCCQAVAPIMREQKYGKIVNIASIAGVTGGDTAFPYSASKAGVINMTQGLARALGPSNVNVNAVNPGLVWTPMWVVTDKWIAEHMPPFKDMPYVPKQVYDAMVTSSTCLKRPTNPEHIANVVAFLASEEASEVTGQHINVDGGMEFH